MSTLYVDNLAEKTSGHGVLIPGSICQVVEQKLSGRTVVNATGTYGQSVASGLKCSITPKSANPTLYIICQLQYTSAGFNAGYILYDNTNSQYVLYNDQSTDGSSNTTGRKYLSSGGLGSSGFNSDGNDYGNSSRTATGKYTPPNNNTLEIEVRMLYMNNVGNIFIGGNESNANYTYDSYSHCSLTLMEIVG
tara:strand:+ start:393 stop:968 length:576 start_codon:yes stop_codon:yes gene_type:complete